MKFLARILSLRNVRRKGLLRRRCERKAEPVPPRKEQARHKLCFPHAYPHQRLLCPAFSLKFPHMSSSHLHTLFKLPKNGIHRKRNGKYALFRNTEYKPICRTYSPVSAFLFWGWLNDTANDGIQIYTACRAADKDLLR